MSDENLSAGKNTDSDNQTEAQSADKPSEQRGNNIPTSNGNKIVETGFFHFARNVIIAGVFATGIWVIGEQFHNQGYLEIGNAANFIACVVFFTVAPFEALKHWRKPLIIWPLFSLFLVVPLAFVFFGLKPKTELEPHPHFTFMVSIPQSDKVELTNDFLMVKEFRKFNKILGVLYVPADTAQSNLTLNIWVRNNSPAFAQDVEIEIFVPQAWLGVPDTGWSPVEPLSADAMLGLTETAPNVFETNRVQTWGYRAPVPLLAGNGFEAPPFHLNKIQMNTFLNGAIGIVARAKDSPADAVNFGLWVLPKSIFTSNDFHKPFVLTRGKLILSPESLKQLQN